MGDSALDQYLMGRTAMVSELVNMADGAIPLEVAAYLGPTAPPWDFVSSIRTVVVRRDGSTAVFDDDDGPHVLIGGRREPGESVVEALARELDEETGSRLIEPPWLLGVLHFQHLASKPDAYAYPYPSFLQAVFQSRVDDADPRSRDDHVRNLRYLPRAEARLLSIPEYELVFLDAALVPSKDGKRGVRSLCFDANRILLVQHEFFDGQLFWVPPGGGIEPGETPAEAAVREVFEETGLRCRILRELECPPGAAGATDYHLMLGQVERTSHAAPADVVDRAVLDIRWHEVTPERPIGPLAPEFWGPMSDLFRGLIEGDPK